MCLYVQNMFERSISTDKAYLAFLYIYIIIYIYICCDIANGLLTRFSALPITGPSFFFQTCLHQSLEVCAGKIIELGGCWSKLLHARGRYNFLIIADYHCRLYPLINLFIYHHWIFHTSIRIMIHWIKKTYHIPGTYLACPWKKCVWQDKSSV